MDRSDSALSNDRVVVLYRRYLRRILLRILAILLAMPPLLLAAWDNLDLGVPGPSDQIVEREGYALGYSEAYEQPLWVSYHLTADEVTNSVVGRFGTFYADPVIRTGSASPDDYTHSGYDRGHLAPVADMRFSTNTMRESFSMANISPQLPAFNRGVWRRLEERVRDIATRERSVYVVTGPVFATNALIRTIGANRVRVPDAFYKVLYIESTPVRVNGFLVPHAPSTNTLDIYLVPLTNIESQTGLDFFDR